MKVSCLTHVNNGVGTSLFCPKQGLMQWDKYLLRRLERMVVSEVYDSQRITNMQNPAHI